MQSILQVVNRKRNPFEFIQIVFFDFLFNKFKLVSLLLSRYSRLFISGSLTIPTKTNFLLFKYKFVSPAKHFSPTCVSLTTRWYDRMSQPSLSK